MLKSISSLKFAFTADNTSQNHRATQSCRVIFHPYLGASRLRADTLGAAGAGQLTCSKKPWK